ncbi:helix-turn-helix transcriptional regulator [bacterium]|nr:helix-turn-helix transcriptional regulator [bacterium]
MIAERLAERLSELRKAASMTQSQLAERAGISRAYLAALERGFSSATKAPPNPSRQVLEDLARALGVERAALLGDRTHQPSLPFPEPSPLPALRHLGCAPGPVPAEDGSPWALPEAEGVVEVGLEVDEGLGLVPGDSVLIRWLSPVDEEPEGLCLIEQSGRWAWGRIAYIAKQPFMSAPDGSYRPFPKGAIAKAVAIALVRRLHEPSNGA